jgi:hypothetical protein
MKTIAQELAEYEWSMGWLGGRKEDRWKDFRPTSSYFNAEGSPTLRYRLRCLPYRLGLRKVVILYVAPNHRFH